MHPYQRLQVRFRPRSNITCVITLPVSVLVYGNTNVHLLSAEPIKSARICISANNYDLFNSHVCEIYLCSKHNHSFTIAYLLRRPIQPVMSMPIRRLKLERKACVAVSHTRSFPFVSHQFSPPYIFESVTLFSQLESSRLTFSPADAQQRLSTQFSLEFPHQCRHRDLTKTQIVTL